jgi:hypothetical protein
MVSRQETTSVFLVLLETKKKSLSVQKINITLKTETVILALFKKIIVPLSQKDCCFRNEFVFVQIYS